MRVSLVFSGFVMNDGTMSINPSSQSSRKVSGSQARYSTHVRGEITAHILFIAYLKMITNSLPPTLRKLYVFEDFNEILNPERSTERPSRALGRAFSAATRSLEHFSAAFLIDAKHFFEDFLPNKPQDPNEVPWKNLRYVVLTSYLLHPKRGRGTIAKLLLAAAGAAALMPKLKIMEIWNGGEGHACIFRYSIDRGRPKISWWGTWGWKRPIRNDVIHSWAALPNHRHLSRRLIATVNRLPYKRNQVKSHAPVIRHIRLRRFVLDQMSRYQEIWEDYGLH